jgi:hypothetical protein
MFPTLIQDGGFVRFKNSVSNWRTFQTPQKRGTGLETNLKIRLHVKTKTLVPWPTELHFETGDVFLNIRGLPFNGSSHQLAKLTRMLGSGLG